MPVRPRYPVDKEKSLAEMPVPLEVFVGVPFGRNLKVSCRNIAIALTDQRSKRSIKRDVKKKSSASTGGEICFSRSSPLKFHFSGEVWLVVHSREFLC